jgi:rod shape-determining protein MreC
VRRLFTYIIRYNFTFIFLLLEIIAFVLIVQNNYHHTTFFKTSNNLTGRVLQTTNNISSYFSLKKTNEQLAEENLSLRQQLSASFKVTDTNTFYQKDSLYRYVYATVVKNSVNRQKNYLLINKGKKHGIDHDMGVITGSGVVGTVVEATENFAKVMSVLHIQNKINARIKKNRHLGNIEWNGKNYKEGLITDVPSHVRLDKGDTIITSGNSLIFPEGLVIGTVSEFQQTTTEKFNSATVQFSQDYNNMEHVYVIISLLKEEVEELTNEE